MNWLEAMSTSRHTDGALSRRKHDEEVGPPQLGTPYGDQRTAVTSTPYVAGGLAGLPELVLLGYGWKTPPQLTPLESQNWLAARESVTTVVPVAMVPETAWLLTGIEVAAAAAPAAVTVNACPAKMTLVPPATATLSAVTGIDATVPVRSEVVATRLGSSGGRSSLLVSPPLIVMPACHL